MKRKMPNEVRFDLLKLPTVLSIKRWAMIFGAIVVFAGCSIVDIPSTKRDSASWGSYPIVGTGQNSFWNSVDTAITAPAQGEAFYGQDAQFPGSEPSYKDNQDETVSDLVTGLMWTQTPDLNGDGTINVADKLTLSHAVETSQNIKVGGYSDWRLPTIKELYSLINFNGVDPKLEDTDTSDLTPFVDTRYFRFGYGDIGANERVIDAQFVTSTTYVGKTGSDAQTVFGVNFADGRIKGYGTGLFGNKKFYVYFVRGNLAYGVNSLTDNADGTVTDQATKLMWSQTDSGSGMDWEHALAWVQTKNDEIFLGHNDWRLPNIKELQSIVDYSRAPGVTASPAIDPVFMSTQIKNEAGGDDYGFYWSSTTHIKPGNEPGKWAAYICFGRAMGKMGGSWIDVHGAGAQRSDPKTGSSLDFPNGNGPQGDAIRILNYVRLVRNIN
jgi:hypothetical protein